jgi:hypothetical protein
MKDKNIIIKRKRKKKVNYVNIGSALILILMAIAMFNFGVMFHNYITKEMKENCKLCSLFDKECPYTDQELLDQEYGGGPCGDMGQYELKFKLGLMFTFGIGLVFLTMSVLILLQEFGCIQIPKGKTY